MLEGLVSNLLNRILGMYVQNFDPKQLSVGIFSGDVKLRNLELRKEALDQLHLPLNVVEGHLGELTLSIPFSNLRGKPVIVNVQDVFILAAPREDADYDSEEDDRRQHRVKMEKLDSAELLKERNTEGMSKEEQQKQQGFAASLATAIIDNLQINVKNIHIRYEDSLSDPGHPFAAGITLRELSAVSTDENWKPAFVTGTAKSSHKLAKLGALGVYWDTDTKLMGTGKGTTSDADETLMSHDEMLEKFRSMITNAESEAAGKHQYILKPVSGQAGIEMDKTGKIDAPKIKARLFFDELGFMLDEDQYRDALMLVDLFHYFIRHQEYKKLQPKSTPKEDPRAWLRFAGQSVLDRIHDRNKRWTWDYMRERRDDRLRYIELFKKKKKEEKLTPAESNELGDLEKKLTYEDLRFWRSLARNQLRKENVGVKKPAQTKTWGQWIWGGQQQESDDTQMTDEQREELYSAIDFDEKKALAESVDLPKETVKLQLRVALQTGSFTLRRDPHGKATEILRLLFDSFSMGFVQRPESSRTTVNLQGLRLYDGTTEGSLFPQMVNVKGAPQVADEDRFQELGDDEDDDTLALKSLQLNDDGNMELDENAFFALAFEQNPLDGSANSAIDMRLKAMEIVYNPRFVVEIAKFFKPPERHMESIGALMDSAGDAVEGIRKQTRAGLEFALEEHKTINAHLDLQAPLIIVPDSVTQKSSICLILDAGHVSVESELVEPDALRDIQSKQKQSYTDQDYKRLEGLMYDKFKVKLQSTQLLIGPSIEATRLQLDSKDDSHNLHLIDRINMDFLVELCIVPKNSELTKFRVTGNLPVLHASVSDAKYKNLMKLIDVAIPKFDRDEGKQPPKASKERRRSSFRPGSVDGKALEAPVRARPRSFQFSSQKHELLLEEEDDHDRQQKFKDAKKGQDDKDVLAKQRNFEFKFVVEKLQGSLYRSDPQGKAKDTLLAELIAEGFALEFYQRPFDITAEVSLRALVLEDHVEESPVADFKNIISSEEVVAGSQKNLVDLRFVKVNAESPEFMTKYEGISTNLDVSVSTINTIVTRKTLLTLLDFALVTFTSSDKPVPEKQPDKLQVVEEDAEMQDVTIEKPSADRIRIKAELKKISVVLNNDGLRLATLSLNTATVALLLAGKTMRVSAKLGNMSLVDDINQGAAEESDLRQLVTIQGDNLADFTYETFDSELDTYPGHDSSIHLRSGSIKINFVTEPFRKIMDFGVKFGKMQAIFNAARQAAANQAEQMQQRAAKMQFDILIKTPIVVFPRIVVEEKAQRDLLTAYLGEIYANNRNIRLTSLLHYPDNVKEELQLIEKVDLGFDITTVDHKPGYKRPDVEIKGKLSDVNLRITSQQLKLVLGLSQTIPAAFATEPEEELDTQVEEELPDSTVVDAKQVTSQKFDELPIEKPSHVGPELGKDSEKWTKMDLIFNAGTVGLELIHDKEDAPVKDIEAASLSQFSLNETNIKMRMMSDNAIEAELLIKSFTIEDTRKRETNRFRKIMSLINTDITQQFMASITISGGQERNLLAILTIDSPQIIVALDYVFAIQTFVNAGFVPNQTMVLEQPAEDEAIDDSESDLSTQVMIEDKPRRKSSTPIKEQQSEYSTTTAFRVNLVDAQIVLLANPTIPSSEAVVLGLKQAIVAKQHATTLQVEKIGMFLCRMDRFDTSRLRILDDFSVATSLDVRSQSENSSITDIQVDIEPLVLRLSLRDILLAMQIFTKASSMSGRDSQATENDEPGRIQELKVGSTIKSKSRRRSSVGASKMAKSIKTHKSQAVEPRGQPVAGSAILKREEMNVHMSGIRIVLIGDLHELPMLDWSVKEFAVDVRDWSGALTAETSIDTYLNVYNFSKSAWEPLIEPWSLGFHMSKDLNPERLSVDLYSRKAMELTLTSATIALASKSADFLTTDEDILSKPRGSDAPYRIRNYTGFAMNVWAQAQDGQEGSAAKMDDGEEVSWRFEDPKTTRETLAPEGATGVVGIKLEGSGFDSVDRISVNREGENIYGLSPRKDKVLHRLLVEVKLGADNVKYITFRSPLLVENNTQIPIEVAVYSPKDGDLLKIDKISPGAARPAPIGACFMHSLVVRPDQGFGYAWSNEHLFWKDLLKRPTNTITCKGEDPNNAPPFYFQMHAIMDKADPLTGIYPHMRIRLSAPVELQNLLPFDFKYRIYDKNTKRDWTNFLRKGGISPGHVVNLSHLLLLSVDLQDTPFKQSDFAIINSPDPEFSREKALIVKDTNDLTLRLKLHYYNIPDSGGAFKVMIYSPYVILNRTGMELDIRSKTFLGSAKAAAGQGVFANESESPETAKPFMFSFPGDDQKNRALMKVGDSGWSKPQSFNAIGSTFSVALPSNNGRSEMQIGVSVQQGEGKYNLTNVVTIAPRFVVSNKIGEDVLVREPGSTETMTLKNGDLHPLRFLKQTSNQQLALCFPVHVKLAKEKQRQQLIRCEILMEDATIFIHMSISKHWPFSIRNESDTEFMFYQANPNLDEDDEDRGSGWRPIRYRLPPRSIMPYAWDFPASRNKDLILDVQSKQRTVKLAEIGQQIPLRLPPKDGRQKVVDIDVVADGPKQSLVLSNWKPSLSLYRQKTGASTKSTTQGFEVKELESDVTFKADVRFAGIGISLINSKMRELLYVTFRDIDVKYSESALYQTLNWTTKWIQIDNQLYGGIFPILMYPSVVPKTGREMESHPIFHAAITRVKDDSYGVLYIKYFTILLQQMTFEVDEDFIFALLDFSKIPGASWNPENARISPAALINNIQGHYVQESLRQVHIVLGSADFLGNPVGLFNNVSSGVADIFYEPYQGLVMTDRPQDLGIGIAKGASSFVKKSVFGFSDSMAKFTGSISKGLAAASMDKEFQDARRMSRSRNRPKHALYGVTAGGNAFANSLASGIGGLARHPLEGAEKEGLGGFVKGAGKGVLGLLTKPAIGAFDLASNLAEGVRNTTTVFDQEGLDRVRLSRFIGQDGIVRPYAQREALGCCSYGRRN
ncbi:hypothetical protein FH972_021590 [Carpinus fangiana]|uniref:Vacuolar protein sorting-associated protein n=1 Tax=Carpinus fangiana TaxID=176857 RepID=A0A5N6KQB8_9ROSI|nr:hypothetical protein FH972_021590 [Carpinus fangiana]